VPISVIPRDEVPFSYLYADIIGPLPLPLGVAKSVTEYLTDLRAKLKDMHEYVDEHSCAQQEKYVAYYNIRTCEKNLKVGDQVIVLLPDSSNKFFSRWQ